MKPELMAGREMSGAALTPEPAGWRGLIDGRFWWRQTEHPKRLWDQLRLSKAYGPWGEEFVAQPDPPHWFIEEWLAGRPKKAPAGK
ncbi:MAG: hypothetical protein GX444_05190 [Myxococcales bacterium]|nr:hypothetical protein [Myxococcales bacterium]